MANDKEQMTQSSDERQGPLARAIAQAATEMVKAPSGPKQAVVYLRVSSRGQVETDYDSEGFSLPAQRQACCRKAASLGADVVAEFVEKGESGTSIKRRKELAALLERVAEGGIDYVIVHKIDRLARSRLDDVAITQAIRRRGARLVSVSENIDDGPSGMLTHGIMASIAEFYSLNLAEETRKGTMQKAQRGGTPGKAPLGYLNVPDNVDGREIRTVVLDSERAPLVKLAFELYATGNYSLSELAPIMAAHGLRSRATPRNPARELAANDLSTLLRNDYYIGVVRYSSVVSEGRHEKLVDDETFQAVQDLLTAKRQSGEKPWRHHHYLRGSIFCGECDGRLVYTRANGRGGVYEYFVCMGRGKGTCTQPHHRVELVERAVEDEYARITLTEKDAARIQKHILSHAASIDSEKAPARSDIEVKLRQLANEEKKLLRAHYDDRVSETVFDEEQQRIRRERIAAEKQLQELEVASQTRRGVRTTKRRAREPTDIWSTEPSRPFLVPRVRTSIKWLRTCLPSYSQSSPPPMTRIAASGVARPRRDRDLRVSPGPVCRPVGSCREALPPRRHRRW